MNERRPANRGSSRRLASLFFTGLVFLYASKAMAERDNLLAYRLFQSGRYAQAAEIFTDPAWKGVALYRSEQWWRASEAFIRADDAVSAYNLGNCYVKMGYYALALEAYLQALSQDPTLADAASNADLMRQLLATSNADKQAAGTATRRDEIDRLESDRENAARGSADSNTVEAEESSRSPTGSDEHTGDQETKPATDSGKQQTDVDGKPSQRPVDADTPQQNMSGDSDRAPEHDTASGGAESAQPSKHESSGGSRVALESDQATTQWLNQIRHDARLYLQRRIARELRLRREAGQPAAQGGSVW